MRKPKSGWELLCEHANEVPNVCPCPPDCGCRYYACRLPDVEKEENDLKEKLVKEIRLVIPTVVLFTHQDMRSSGNPDLELNANRLTSHYECKHATPNFKSQGRQELVMARLALASHYARYIIWYSARDGREKKTESKEPSSRDVVRRFRSSLCRAAHAGDPSLMTQPLTIEERNALICQSYLDGSSQSDLAERFSITTARVGQVLHKAGLVKEDRPTEKKVKRGSFTGVHLSKNVKTALRTEAKKEETSMSEWVANLVTAELVRRNVVVVERPVDLDAFLPFEEVVQ